MTLLAWLSLFCAALPFGLGLVNLLVYRTPGQADRPPAMSVLVPARNEEANIGAACAAILANTDVDLELIVMDDHSTDATGAILRDLADPRLRVATAPPLPAGWSGKQHACARLAELASHDLLLFVDADVRLAPDALSRIGGYMQRSNDVLASGFPRQVTLTFSERLLLPLIHFLLFGFLPMPAMRLLTAPSLGAGCGQLMVVRRAAYERAGGHAAIRASLHDGIMLPRAFRRAGLPTGLFDASRLATCRMYASGSEAWRGFTKNATEGMARPIALPVWTVLLAFGQIAPPLPVCLASSLPAADALACGLLLRLVLAIRFRQNLMSVLLHPLGVGVLLALQWNALLRAARRRPAVWRGRAYPAQ